jgi:serine/threonine protein kinase
MTEYYDPKTYPTRWNFLESGTIIDQYIIERELAHGGFSSVYLAKQRSSYAHVTIKEYLPRKFAHRTWNNIIVPNDKASTPFYLKGRTRFFKEANVLATLKHPNIVDVINFFQANETAYMVMTYHSGMTLDKIIKQHTSRITERQFIKIFDLLLSGVGMIHQHGILHLDIKPNNILIRPQNNPILLDFGANQPFPTASINIDSTVITHGFSPPEQYNQTDPRGPWTDIYAIGATMYFCLSKKRPMHANKRKPRDRLPPATKVFKRQYPQYLLHAIDWAMKVEIDKRPQSVEIFRHALSDKV